MIEHKQFARMVQRSPHTRAKVSTAKGLLRSILTFDIHFVNQVSLMEGGGGCQPQSAIFPTGGESAELCNFEDLLVDHTVVASSLVEEFTFLCSSEWKRTIYSALYMFGMLFGSYFFGWSVKSISSSGYILILGSLTVLGD